MKKVGIALFGALFVLLAACSSTPPEPANITITLDEYSFAPEDIELRVGQEVTITLVNTGALDHEFMIGRDVNYNANLQPTGYAVDFFAAAGVAPSVSGGGMLMDHSEMDHSDEEDMGEMGHSDEEDMGEMDHSEDEMSDAEMGPFNVNMVFQPVGSDSTTITFTVTEEMLGEWEIGCFQLDGVHYTSGMVGTLTVTD